MSSTAPLPPGPAQPRAWQILRYQRAPLPYVEACAHRFGPVFTLRLPVLGPVVAAVDPEDVRTILRQAPERFPDGPDRSPIAPIMGEKAMMFAVGETHRHRRRTLLAAFRGGLGARWSEEMTRAAEVQLARLPMDEPVASLSATRRIALEMICRLVFGRIDPFDFDRLRDEVGRRDDPRLALMLLFPTLWTRGGRLNPGGGLKRRRDTVNRLLLQQISLRRTALDDGAERNDVLSLLVAARDEFGRPLVDAEIRDQLVGLVLAGHETTAAALAWALERISRSPQVRERLAAELAAGRTGYLDAVVRESLRVRPPVLDVLRTTTVPVELGAHRIPPGTSVSAMCAVAQRRAAVWDEPLVFRPERFLGDDPAPDAFAPFGGGVRRCIAASFATLLMQIVVRTAVERFAVTAAPGPEEQPRVYGLSLLPSRGGRVVLRSHRTHSTRSSSISGGRVASQLG